MNSDPDSYPEEYRHSTILLLCGALSPVFSFVCAVWCAFIGIYFEAGLWALVSLLGLISPILMMRSWIVVHQDYLEFQNGFSAARRVERGEIVSVGCRVGSPATLTLADDSVVPLPAPGTTPHTLFRALDWWLKHPEHP